MKAIRVGAIGLGQRIAHVLRAMQDVDFPFLLAGYADPAPVGTPILKERDISQLESSVTGGKTSYDSVSQFAGKYGQSSAVVSALTGYLAKFGITTSVYAGNVDVSASGTRRFETTASCVSKPGVNSGLKLFVFIQP